MIYLCRKICVRPYLHHPSRSIPGIRASWEDNTYIGGDDDDNGPDGLQHRLCDLMRRCIRIPLGSIRLHFIQHDASDISRKTDKGGLAFIPHRLNDHTAAAVVISAAVAAAVAVTVGEINLRRRNSRGGGRRHGGGGQQRRRQHVARRGERWRRPLPPENNDSARAEGPYAMKEILQEEGSDPPGGHQ